jgi:NADH dehydrogenase FAD-containing subunit
VAPRFEGLLTGLNFVQGAATAVDLDNRRVTIESPSVATPHAPEAAASATTTTTTADEPATEEAAASSTSAANSENAPPTSTTSLQFDRLIVALGSEAADLGNVPGAAEHALPFYTLEHAEQLQVKGEGDVCSIRCFRSTACVLCTRKE